MTIYLSTVYACAYVATPRVDDIEKGESVQLSICPYRTSLHHWQRFCMECFQLIFAFLCKIISAFNRSQAVLIGDDYTMETSVMINLYKSSKNLPYWLQTSLSHYLLIATITE